MEQENRDQIQTDGQEQVSISKEEYDRLLGTQKDLETTKEQLKASTRESQKLHWIAQISKDNSKFGKLYNSDKRQAEAVAQHFGMSAEEFYTKWKENYWSTASDSIDMDDVDARVQQKVAEWIAKEKLEAFKQQHWITWKFDKQFMGEFNDLMKDKERTEEEVLKQCRRAFKLIDDDDEFQEAIAKSNSRLAWAGIAWSSRSAWGSRSNTPYDKYMQQKNNASLKTYWKNHKK